MTSSKIAAPECLRLLASVPMPIVAARVENARLVFANRAARDVLGLGGGDLKDLTLRDHLAAPDVDILVRQLRGGKSIVSCLTRVVTCGGKTFSAHVSATTGGPDAPGVMIASLVHVSEHGEAEGHLIQRAFDASPTAMLVTSTAGKIVYVNGSFRAATGFERRDVVGQHIKLLKPRFVANYVYRDVWKSVAAGRTWSGELYSQTKDGQGYLARATLAPLPDETGRVHHFLGTFEELTVYERAAEDSQRNTRHDGLAGLPNRAAAMDCLSATLDKASRSNLPVVVMLADVDQFKAINAAYGHSVGDAVLACVTERLREAVGSDGFTVRLGDDEFLLVLPDPDDALCPDLTARRVLDVVQQRMDIEGLDLFMTMSVGSSIYPLNGGDAPALLRNCRAAVGRAKDAGGNCHRRFSADIDDGLRTRLDMQSALRRAMANGELHVKYQPLVNMGGRCLEGAEGLLRWNSREFGQVPPGRFIPLAEENGPLICAIGEWVLRAACKQASAWVAEGLLRYVAVNVSSRQLQDRQFPKLVADVLSESGLPATALKLEITESFLLEDPEHIECVLGTLSQMGVSLAVDDFGTGYSALSYLRCYPFDTLKIDGSFVRQINVDKNAALIRAIIGMAAALGLTVVAEGVETGQQCDTLRGLGCDIAQGFHFAPPLNAEEFRSLAVRYGDDQRQLVSA